MTAPDDVKAAIDVLVVDDDGLVRTIVADTLESDGYRVTTATGGLEALEALCLHDFDVVVSDLQMPGLSGLELLKEVRERYPDTEVIILTGQADMESTIQCLRLGAFDFVRKEREMPDLHATVRRAVELRNLRGHRDLLALSKAIFTAHERQDLPERIVHAATEVMSADDSALMLPDVNGQLYISYSDAEAARVEDSGQRLLAEGTAARVAKGRDPVVINSAPRDGAVRSSIIFPLFSADTLLGVLCLNRVRSARRPFRQRDLELASLLATQVVLALENQQLIRRITASDKFTAIGQLSTAIAHEINNPIAYVLSGVEFVRDRLDLALGEQAQAEGLAALGGPSGVTELRDAIQDAHHGASRVRDVVRDLRSMVRGNPEAKTAFDINDSIQAALRVCAAEVHPTAQTLLDLGEGLEVLGSRGTMSQVFVNLVVNAAYAMREAGRPQARLSITSRRDGLDVVVDVSDTGTGMPPEVVARIFEPFFTTKPLGVGTGLGLPTCRDIVRWHGGELRVVSTPGVGTTFQVIVPAIDENAPADLRPSSGRAAPRAATGQSRRRVLVVDDEAAICRALVRSLPDCEVVTAENGVAALEALKRHSDFSVILCDVLMPEMSGPQLYDQIAARFPALAGRVVFVTGSAGYADVTGFAATRGIPVLEKPLERATLRGIVEQPRS